MPKGEIRKIKKLAPMHAALRLNVILWSAQDYVHQPRRAASRTASACQPKTKTNCSALMIFPPTHFAPMDQLLLSARNSRLLQMAHVLRRAQLRCRQMLV